MAVRAKEYCGVPHISTGDLFRAAIKNETPLGLKVKAILAAGELVPDEVTVAMVEERLAEKDAQKGFILDGFPRTIPQADALASISDLDMVVNFVISEEEVVKRLSGRRVAPSTGRIYHILFNPPKVEGKDDETGEDLIQREDDREESILNRLRVYHEATAPLIAYYRDKGILVDIDAAPHPEEVFESFKKLVKK